MRRSFGGSFGVGPTPLLVGAILLALSLSEAQAQTLRGSQASLDRQNAQARAHDFTFLRSAEDVRRFVDLGYLVPVRSTRDLEVHAVSFPYARPEVRLFLERLSAQYRSACGEMLVVTSLTRPRDTQPRNASSRSVHPTGMAADIRRPTNMACRRWLESTLLSLQGQGVLEAVYERHPPHYHVAVFPRPYARYVTRVTGDSRIVERARAADDHYHVEWTTHTVEGGETLLAIGERYGTPVSRIQAENGLRGHRIFVGQELRIPVYRTEEAPAPSRVRATEAEAEAGPDPDADGEPAGGEGAEPDGRSLEGEERIHTVSRGESLWTIARRYGVSELAIRAANDLADTRIVAGQDLRIPDEGEMPTRIRHRVRPGESLWTIARSHGTTVDTLRRENGITSDRIVPGQVLEVPIPR